MKSYSYDVHIIENIGPLRWLTGKALATKPDYLSLIPQSQIMEGERQLSQAVLCPLHI